MVAVSKFLNFCSFVALICYRPLSRVLIKLSESLQFWLFTTSTPIFVGWTREFSSGKIYRTKLFVGQNYSSNIMCVTKFLPVSRTSHCFVRGCVVYSSLSVIIVIIQLTLDMSTKRYLELSLCRTKSQVTWSFSKLKNDRYLELFHHPPGSWRYRASTLIIGLLGS